MSRTEERTRILSVDRLKADAKRFRAPAAAALPPSPTAPIERLAAVGKAGGRRTRRTVELTPAQHHALDIWQREMADRLGVARVTGQEVLTALVDQLLNDRELSRDRTHHPGPAVT
jgi:hypothetical protein